MKFREGTENLRTKIRMVFYCFSLDFFGCFCGISRQTVILTNYSLLCFTAWLGFVKQLSSSTVEYVCNKEASRSCGNIRSFDQNYQPVKVILQVSVLIITYLVAVLFG